MDHLSKDADYRDYELFLESLEPSDEELEFWLNDMYRHVLSTTEVKETNNARNSHTLGKNLSPNALIGDEDTGITGRVSDRNITRHS